MNETTSDDVDDTTPVTATEASDGRPTRRRPRFSSSDAVGPMTVAAVLSIAAGVIHAGAIGSHADLVGLSRLFLLAALAQVGVGFLAAVRPTLRLAAIGLVVVNGGAVGFWAVTRTWGLSFIDGLGSPSSIGLSDGLAAGLAGSSALLAVLSLSSHRVTRVRVPVAGLGILALIAVGAGVVDASSPDHDHGSGGGHSHGSAESAHAHGAAAGDDHHGDDHGDDHGDEHGDGDDHAHDEEVAWPRPWDPTGPIDFSDVPGVSADQQARAEALVATTLEVLPQFGDVTSLADLGYRSIGDARTGHEHYINLGYIFDEHFLDPQYPESLVFEVDGDDRTLVSAMFIANDRSVDDPELVAYGGPLMEWHVHDNLCWGRDENGTPVVKGVTENFGGTCPPDTVLAGGGNPMVHVWIAPHACGPFAALEGHGAGQAAGDGPRADQCAHDHGGGHGHGDAVVPPTPYDPELPIDLSGVEGVSAQQQAYAENLVAVTLRYLPQWSDPEVAMAAGFHSIGDGGTGHEHFINWDWIDDEVWLDPNYPESLVYEVGADGSRTLVSAMFMLPPSMELADIPDWGGRLMQWHVHDDLCFTDDPVAPTVARVVAVGGACPPPTVKLDPAPMIHVWITPHRCGPFSALEGIGAGQVQAGEEHFCNHAHGTG